MKKTFKILAIMLVMIIFMQHICLAANYTQELEDYINNRRPNNSSDYANMEEFQNAVAESDYNFWLELAKNWCEENNIKVKVMEGAQGGELVDESGNSITVRDVFNGIDDQIDNQVNQWGSKVNKELILAATRDAGTISDYNLENLKQELIKEFGNENGTVTEDPNGEIVESDQNVETPDWWQNSEPGYQTQDYGFNISDLISAGTDALFGVLLYPLKLIIITIAGVFDRIIEGVASIGGATNGTISLGDILFTTGLDTATNGQGFKTVPIVAIDFFNKGGSDQISTIRTGVANWFYVFRNLAFIISLCVLIYTGIRMAISSIAEDKARYKSLLKNWVVQMILVAVMQYIVFLVIGLNTTMVNSLTGVVTEDAGYESYKSGLLSNSMSPTMTVGFGSAIIYCILLGVTFAFLIMYIKRMITIAFLIIISPLVTVTYAIDKVGDSRSQAMNTWLKEFAYNVLIQPFHCIIYAVFVGTAMSLLTGSNIGNFGAPILAIIAIMFMFKAEDILRKIFAFDKNAQSLGSGLASAAMLGAGLQTVSSMFKKESSSQKQGSNNEPVPDLAAIHQNQAATQAKENEEQTSSAINSAQNEGRAVTAAEMERIRRRNREEERRRQSGGAADAIKAYGIANAKAALPVFSALVGAGSGDLSKAASAGMAGYGIQKGVQNIASGLSKGAESQAKANMRAFQIIYKELDEEWSKNGGPWEGLTNEEKINEYRKALKISDINSIQDKKQRQFVQEAHIMNETLKAAGYKYSEGAVLETIRRVQGAEKNANKTVERAKKKAEEQVKRQTKSADEVADMIRKNYRG